MSYENSAGLGVNNHYGVRDTQDGIVGGGRMPGFGGERESVVYVTGGDFAGGVSFNTLLTIPAGSVFSGATFEVLEVFTVGNADNVINVGTDGSESTNGVALADPEAVGVSQDLTGAGTWAAALAADTAVGVSVTGTTPSVAAGSGKAKVVVRYTKI